MCLVHNAARTGAARLQLDPSHFAVLVHPAFCLRTSGSTAHHCLVFSTVYAQSPSHCHCITRVHGQSLHQPAAAVQHAGKHMQGCAWLVCMQIDGRRGFHLSHAPCAQRICCMRELFWQFDYFIYTLVHTDNALTQCTVRLLHPTLGCMPAIGQASSQGLLSWCASSTFGGACHASGSEAWWWSRGQLL